MKKLLPILICLSVLILNSSCLKDDDSYGNASIDYSTTISPLQYAYFVGDTISIRSDINAVFNFDNREPMENANTFINYRVSIVEVQPNNQNVTPAFNSFEVIGKETIVIPPIQNSSTIDLGSTCGNWRCNFEIEIIPENPGIYAIVLSRTEVENDSNGTTFLNGKFSHMSDNFSVCQEINTDQRNEIGTEGFGTTDSYFFKVE